MSNSFYPGGGGMHPWSGPISLSDTFIRQFSNLIQPQWSNIQGTSGVVSLVGHTHAWSDIISGNLLYGSLPTGAGTWAGSPTISGTLGVVGTATFGNSVATSPRAIFNAAAGNCWNQYKTADTNRWAVGVGAASGTTNWEFYSYSIPGPVLTMTQAGIISLLSAVVTGAAAGEIVLPNAKGLRASNAGGTNTIRLIQLNANDRVLVGAGTSGSIMGIGTTDLESWDYTAIQFGPRGFFYDNNNGGVGFGTNAYVQSGSFKYRATAGACWLQFESQDLYIRAIASGTIDTNMGSAFQLYFSGDVGSLGINTTVKTSAASGEIILPNTKNLRAVNAAGADTLGLLSLDATNVLVINQISGLGNSPRQVLVGAPDSGGAGYRMLRVVN